MFPLSPQFKFSKKNFQRLEIPDLLIHILSYNDESHVNCPVCIQYEKWCLEVAKSKWQSEFLDFKTVITNIKQQNKVFLTLERLVQLIKTLFFMKHRINTYKKIVI